MLTEPEKRRYNRHIMLPDIGQEGQEKLKKAKVLVVGTGGLGSPVLQYLTAAGVGTLALMDDDLVSEDNLHRQILYGGHDLGKLKTIIAKQKLNSLNPFVKHEVLNVRLKKENALDFISKYDLVIDATDNYSTRYLINDACIIKNKPWIFGAVYNWEGQVSVFNYKNGPTLRCIFPDIEEGKNIIEPSKTGLFGILPGVIGSFQAVEAIKIITGTGDVLSGTLINYNLLTNDFQKIKFKLCSDDRNIKELKDSY
jgi:molybdopterin/thiamine biosynthesis adenylyltransferase